MKGISGMVARAAATVFIVTVFAQTTAQAAAKSAVKAAPASVGAKAGDHFGDWVVECPTFAGKSICFLSQTIVGGKEQRRLVKFSVRKNVKPAESQFTALVPLGIFLPAGVTVTLAVSAKEAPRQLSLQPQVCTPQGCVASTRLETAALKSAQADGKLAVSFALRPGAAPVQVSGSLKGLAEGLAALPD